MAEATLTAETEVTPSEDVAVITPDSPTESAPAPENVETTPVADEPSVAASVLESIRKAVAENAGVDGLNATPDVVVPPAQPSQPSAEQIRQQERERVNSENRINGLRWVVAEDAPAKLAKLESELSDEGREILRTEINRMKGAFEPLLARTVDVDTNLAPQIRSAAHTEAEAFTLNQFAEAAEAVFGKGAGKAFVDARPTFRSWVDVGEYFAKESRKGYVSQEAYDKAFEAELDKYEKSLNDRGAAGIVTSTLKQITGSTGPETPAARGGSGGALTPNTYAAKLKAGEVIDPAQVDEMTVRFTTGG